MVKLVVNLVIFERRTERCGDAAGDAEALMAVVENMQEGKSGVFANCRRCGWVNEVPG